MFNNWINELTIGEDLEPNTLSKFGVWNWGMLQNSHSNQIWKMMINQWIFHTDPYGKC
jgi:hypothetical protein